MKRPNLRSLPTSSFVRVSVVFLTLLLCTSACNFAEDLDALENSITSTTPAETTPSASCDPEAFDAEYRQYCLEIEQACTGTNNQYPDADGNFDTCGCLTAIDGRAKGLEGDTAGDTLQCRFYHIGAALSSGPTGPSDHCAHAGPVGAGVCQGGGSPCGTLCTDLSETCPLLFSEDNYQLQCQAACIGNGIEALQASAVFEIDETNLANNTIECRREALDIAKTLNGVRRLAFCAEASPEFLPGQRLCVDPTEERSCATYCDRFDSACGDINCETVGDDACRNAELTTTGVECLTECVRMSFIPPNETLPDPGPVECRNRMIQRAADARDDTGDDEARAEFCREASPDSPTVCAGDRPCETYCRRYDLLCNGVLESSSVSTEVCIESCVGYDKVGTPGERDSNSIACRVTALQDVETLLGEGADPSNPDLIEACVNAHPSDPFVFTPEGDGEPIPSVCVDIDDGD